MPIRRPENPVGVIPEAPRPWICTRRNDGKRFLLMRILGIILIVVGLLAISLPYVSFTKKEKIIDFGPIEAVAETQERIPISPIIGLLVFVGGVGIVIASVVKKS